MIKEVKLFQFFTTPQQLRGIADKLEREMKNSYPGQNVPFCSNYSKDGASRLDITIDQDAWYKEGN